MEEEEEEEEGGSPALRLHRLPFCSWKPDDQKKSSVLFFNCLETHGGFNRH